MLRLADDPEAAQDGRTRLPWRRGSLGVLRRRGEVWLGEGQGGDEASRKLDEPREAHQGRRVVVAGEIGAEVEELEVRTEVAGAPGDFDQSRDVGQCPRGGEPLGAERSAQARKDGSRVPEEDRELRRGG